MFQGLENSGFISIFQTMLRSPYCTDPAFSNLRASFSRNGSSCTGHGRLSSTENAEVVPPESYQFEACHAPHHSPSPNSIFGKGAPWGHLENVRSKLQHAWNSRSPRAGQPDEEVAPERVRGEARSSLSRSGLQRITGHAECEGMLFVADGAALMEVIASCPGTTRGMCGEMKSRSTARWERE